MSLLQPHFEYDDVAIATGRTHVRDLDLAKQVGAVLFAHYPDHAWLVRAAAESGYVSLQNMGLDMTNGVLLHVSNLDGPAGIAKKAKWAGGEILERFNVARRKYAPGDYEGRTAKARFQKPVVIPR